MMTTYRTLRMATAAIAALAVVPVLAQTPTGSAPANAEIQKIIAERVDIQRQSVGIVVGVIDAAGRRVVSHGHLGEGDARTLNGDTIFEIGSISKVFTALLLADAVERKEVALTDPVSKYLPSTVRMPERGRAITLQDLASHMSALPRLPGNMAPKDQLNPYADYTVDQLYQFLSSAQLTRDVGTRFEYSNLGGGLLGHVLALRAGTDYETLVKTRLTGPLGMTSTAIVLTPDLKARLAIGHTPMLAPTPYWDLPSLAGAGALRSSTNDMLTFLSAALGYTSSPLAPAFARMTSMRQSAGPGMEIGLGWLVASANGKEIVWHNGGTGGFRTIAAYDAAARTGVVVLSNASTIQGVDDIGRHLLDRKSPLLALTAPKVRTAITVDPSLLDTYAGRYQLAPTVFVTVSRDGSRFLVHLTGQPVLEAFAETQTDFFLKAVDAQFTFETDANGKPTAVVLHQMGRDQRAARVP